MVLTLLAETGVALILRKCGIFTNHIHYFEHVTKLRRLEDAEDTADAIRELKIPTTVTIQCSFLGLCSVFRPSVSNLARMFSPLPKRLGKTEAKQFEPPSKKDLKALDVVKENLV